MLLNCVITTSLVAQTAKHLPAMQEIWVRSLGREDPLEKEMATHSSTLAWKIPRTLYETSRQSRFDAGYWMLGAGALGRPRGMEWGGRREEGSGWGTHVYLWWIHFDI